MPASDPAEVASQGPAQRQEGHDPEFGPGGYLPERAAKRARKIVLREQMGLQWPIAAGLAALIVLVAGGLYLATGTGPPGRPYHPIATIDDVDPRGAAVFPAGSTSGALEAPSADVLVVRAGGGVRSFLAPPEVVWCEASGRLEAPDGRVWNASGRLVGGSGESLSPVPSQVHDGILYVDGTAPAPRAPADDRGETPACV